MVNKNKKGILLPPAIGYSLSIVLGFLSSFSLSIRYFPKYLLLVLINCINLPFRWYERLFINPRFKKDDTINAPIFILGHWRSGTTHLHNLLCQDQQMAYVSTYQSVFPDTLFTKLGRFLFRNFSALLMPGTRNGDNVKLGPSLPQEEEFTVGARYPISFYYFWMFPRNMVSLYNRSIRFQGVNERLENNWKQYYKTLINKAITNTGKRQFLSKNPPNTGRIKQLLSMYPSAKFIHIHRNPIEVFLSTQNFYDKMMPPLQLQTISKKEIDSYIIEVYKRLMGDFLEQKKVLNNENLIEISFKELEENPTTCLQNIYETLQISGYKEAVPYLHSYIDKLKHYKKNTHQIDEEQVSLLLKEWQFIFDAYNYSIPDTIIVKK